MKYNYSCSSLCGNCEVVEMISIRADFLLDPKSLCQDPQWNPGRAAIICVLLVSVLYLKIFLEGGPISKSGFKLGFFI